MSIMIISPYCLVLNFNFVAACTRDTISACKCQCTYRDSGTRLVTSRFLIPINFGKATIIGTLGYVSQSRPQMVPFTGGKSVESFRNHCAIEQRITQKSIKRMFNLNDSTLFSPVITWLSHLTDDPY